MFRVGGRAGEGLLMFSIAGGAATLVKTKRSRSPHEKGWNSENSMNKINRDNHHSDNSSIAKGNTAR